MKIRTFNFPTFEEWYNSPKRNWEQEIGGYVCTISKIELFGNKSYYIQIMYRGFACYREYVYTDKIGVDENLNTIKKWYNKNIAKASKAWKKELKPFFIE